MVYLFCKQIKYGVSIKFTHSEITRCFMTTRRPPNSLFKLELWLLGGVFVLDMREPVRIYDLASRIVELSGLIVRNEKNPQDDIEITVTGLRPSEKLLIGDDPKRTQHPRILKAHEKFIFWAQLQGKLQLLNLALSVNDVPVLRSLLQQLVTGYQPSDEVVDWVHLEQERQALNT